MKNKQTIYTARILNGRPDISRGNYAIGKKFDTYNEALDYLTKVAQMDIVEASKAMQAAQSLAEQVAALKINHQNNQQQ